MIRNADHWRIVRPISTHFKTVSCAEVNCPNYYNGWMTVLSAGYCDEVAFIRRSKLAYTEEQMEGGLIRFVFAPGQECFEGQAGNHKSNLERDPIFLKNRTVQEPEQWKDGIGESLYRLGRQ